MRTPEAIRSELRASGHDELADLHDEGLICYERVRLGLGLPVEQSAGDAGSTGMTTPTPIPLRPADLADEFEARAGATTEIAKEAGPDTAPSYHAWANAMLEAAALARGAKPLEHAEPEIVAHQPVVIEMHSPASIGRMSATERQAHREDVNRVIRSMQVQLERLGRAGLAEAGLVVEAS